MKNRIETLIYGTVLISAVAATVVGCGRASDVRSGTTGATTGSTGATTGSTGATSMGMQTDDNAITDRVKSALSEDPMTKNLDLKVETHQGDVSLSGYADNSTQLDRATTTVRAIPSVKSIRNNIVVKPQQSLSNNAPSNTPPDATK